MVTRLKLVNGRVVVIEQTTTAIRARWEDEPESTAKPISTEKYLKYINEYNGIPVGNIT